MNNLQLNLRLKQGSDYKKLLNYGFREIEYDTIKGIKYEHIICPMCFNVNSGVVICKKVTQQVLDIVLKLVANGILVPIENN